MSRPWSRSVRLRVVPGSACGTLEQGWLRPRLLASAAHTTGAAQQLPEHAGAPPSDRADDEQALAVEAVLLELASTAPLKGARLFVELADTLTHLDVVAGDFAGDSERQLQSIASACVDELLGDGASRYEIRWQLQSDGKHLLIGAMVRDQIQSFAAIAARHGLSLRSVQPDFCLQWNRHATALTSGSAVFAVASGREAVVAHVSQGAVAAISSGAWLDRHDAPGHVSASVQNLLCGFGLDPSATAGALDARVDRLLASAGIDAADQSAYVLVAPKVSNKAVSSRWTVVNRESPAP